MGEASVSSIMGRRGRWWLAAAACIALAVGPLLFCLDKRVGCRAAADGLEGPSKRTAGAAKYPGNKKDMRVLSADYSVVRAFIYAQWGFVMPEEDFLRSGRKAHVDARIGPWTFNEPERLPGLGGGLEVSYNAGWDRVYRDRHGVRLIVQANAWSDGLILTTECRHPGALVQRDLRSLQTGSGLRLRDTETRTLKLLGRPSRRDSFRGYDILWYVEKPKRVVSDGGAYEYTVGRAAAYALKKGRLVEIWLLEWDTQAGG